jgi:hypothetical protein
MENGPKHEWKNIRVGINPVTGRRYFERRKVEVIDPTQPPEETPDEDFLTKDQFESLRMKNAAEKSNELGNPSKGSESLDNFKSDNEK